MYKSLLEYFGRQKEIDLGQDLNHWAKLKDDEQHFIKNILAFFAGSDGIVLRILVLDL